MKVLMTADTVGGVFRYAADLARALRADVVLATMGRPLSEDQRATLDGLSVHESAFALEWMPEPWDDVEAAGEWLRELEARERPDVVHLNGYAHAGMFRAPALVVGHSCVVSWWHAVHGTGPPPEWERYRGVVRDGLAAADAVVAPTASMLRELDRFYGPLPALRRVIPNGSERPARESGDSPLILTGDGPFVLAGGRLWDAAKNLAALARAAAGLAWPVVVAGELDGPPPVGVEHLGLLSRDELADVRARAPIFAHPARYEPFGLAPLEAALDGCALVLGDIPSLREVWGDAALYARDDRALHDALARLIGDPSLRREMAARAHLRARRYTVARMAGAYRSLYSRLATAVPA